LLIIKKNKIICADTQKKDYLIHKRIARYLYLRHKRIALRYADTTASNNIKSFEAQANASITNATLRIISIKY
jgi:hypothetical protein